jgi:SAM-dependent methyltransferase
VASREYYERAADGLVRWLRPWLPQDREAHCLDLGCGCGETLYLLEREGFRHTVGVNLCQEELEQARLEVKGQRIHADVLDYLRQSQTASVDFMTALNFLEHLSKDMLLTILTEARRVLRPGGTLIAMVPNAISPFSGVTRHWDLTHEWAFVPNNFQQLVALTGFDAHVEFRECGPAIHGLFSAVRYLLWQIIRAGIATYFLIEVGNPKGGIYTMDMLVRLHTPRRF